jgi:two-component system, chemotaxis family, sensor kinase CheA
MISDAIKEEFVNESQEHLATAEDDVLALEHSAGADRQEIINRLFRSLHTIKGGAACVEMQGIKTLAHALENVVGAMRDGVIAIKSDFTQTLLDGLDLLKKTVTAGIDFNADGDTVIAQCETIVSSAKEQEENGKTGKNSKTGRIFTLASYDLSDVRNRSLHCFEFTIDLNAECKRGNCSPAQLSGRIKSIGSMLAKTNDLDNFTDMPASAMQCSFLIATLIDEPEILFPGLEIEPVSFYKYTAEEISMSADEGITAQPTDSGVYKLPAGNATVKSLSLEEKKPQPSPAQVQSGSTGHEKKASDDQTVRIPVETIDKLMNLAGELVVVRNRNSQVLPTGNIRELLAVNQRLDTVTTEIQAMVMRTRMCAVGGVFGRFTRVVRDLGKRLSKEIELEITGADVELDKSIIDGLFDPLTHLVRNSADHGIEQPSERLKAGKSEIGHLRLSAFHQAGWVNIRVDDDGKGIDPVTMRKAAVEKGLMNEAQAQSLSDRDAINLIFLPGFSTAAKITDVSGRGVGMDAVKTSLQKLGGVVEIQSVAGKGTTVIIRLPLTLAIISALILTIEEQCFAIPQVNVVEVVWLHGDEPFQSIRLVDGKEVYWLRGKMLPLLRLSKILKLNRSCKDPSTGERMPDRRVEAPDRRQNIACSDLEKRKGPVDRRTSIENSLYIIVLRIGADTFGLCVERIVDTEEIVVKPLHDRLKACRVYAGVTVLGDGVTALILDIPELARIGGVCFDNTEAVQVRTHAGSEYAQKMLLFSIGGPERFAIPLSLLMRVDEVRIDELQTGGDKEYLRFRESVIPFIRIERILSGFSAKYDSRYLFAIIPKIGNPIGVAASEVIDIAELDEKTESAPIDAKTMIGTQLIGGRMFIVLDLCAIIETAQPGWFTKGKKGKKEKRKVVIAEDSQFLRAFLASYLRGVGLEVLAAANGKDALQLIEKENGAIDGIISDLEMPVLNGFELAREIKSSASFKGLPILAISAMDEAIARPRALDAGFDDFRPKNNFPSVAEAFNNLIAKKK